jgi:threonine dehydrogenase-like Zn-dependent dehydrogenase
LTAIAARDRGAARVVISEPARRRRELACRLGFEVLDPASGFAALGEALGPNGADVAFDAAGHPSLPSTLTALVRSGGSVVVIGMYFDPQLVNLGDVVTREITLLGTRALTRTDTAAALELTKRRMGELSALIDDVVRPTEVGVALEKLRNGRAIKLLVDCAELTG